MSDITAAIRDHLEAESDITDIVGTRIRRSWARSSDILPYLTITKTGGTQPHHMGGASGLGNATVEINCWAASRGGANQLSELVRETLDGLPVATMGDDNLDVRTINLNGPAIELDEPPTDGSQQGVFRDLLEFNVWHAQSVPA